MKEKAAIETNVIEIKKEVSMQDAILAIVQRTDIDPDRLEKFLDLQIKMENRQAEQQFNEALSGFQGKCPIITKKKKVSFNTTKYEYAPLDEIIFVIKPFLSEFGLSYSFDIKSEAGLSTMITTIYHKAGHSKNFFYAFDALGEGTMNQSQKRKSATTYAKRAGLENALGIVTAGEDDDALRAVDSQISKEQIDIIKDLMTKTNTLEKNFFEFLQISKLDELSGLEAKKAINALKSKRVKNVHNN
jgi:hypothetical protein